MTGEKPKRSDFSRFFTRPQGLGTVFNEDAFAERYGIDAARALGRYSHFTANKPKNKGDREKLYEAIRTIEEKVGVHPCEIKEGGEKELKMPR